MDNRSGVSQRLPISVLENAISNAERRAIGLGEERVVPRVSDVYAAMPSITGKLELEYEGELQGGDTIARELIRRAAGRVLDERLGGADLSKIVAWFDQGGALKVSGDERAEVCCQGLRGGSRPAGCRERFGLAPSGTTSPTRLPRASCCSKVWPRRSGSAAPRSWATPGPSRNDGSRDMGRAGFQLRVRA